MVFTELSQCIHHSFERQNHCLEFWNSLGISSRYVFWVFTNCRWYLRPTPYSTTHQTAAKSLHFVWLTMTSGRLEDHSSSVLVLFARLNNNISFLRYLSTCTTNIVNIEPLFCLWLQHRRSLCHGGPVFGETCHVINFHMTGQFILCLVLNVVFLIIIMNMKLVDCFRLYPAL